MQEIKVDVILIVNDDVAFVVFSSQPQHFRKVIESVRWSLYVLVFGTLLGSETNVLPERLRASFGS